MPVNKVRRNGSFAPLSAQAYKDDALMEAGEAAELLFYRALSFSADVLRDGFVTDSQLVRVVAHGMRDARKRADKLVAVNLWTREDGGYNVRSWLKWNRSREEIEELQDRDTRRKPKSSERIPNGNQSESEPEPPHDSDGIQSESDPSHAGRRARPPSPSPSPTPTTEKTSLTAARRAEDTALFDAFWEAYPRKVGKDSARKAWTKATKTTSTVAIIEGAKNYAEQRGGEDPQYTAHPASWLNAGRWADERVTKPPVESWRRYSEQ